MAPPFSRTVANPHDAPPAISRLGLEVASLPRAARFYTDAFRLVPVRYESDLVAFDVGGTTLALRRPTDTPRGGVHVHYALTAPAREYGRWRARFPDVEQVTFGDAQSLYPFDPDGHCPEVACFGDRGTGLTGVFEVVLEVTDLDASEAAYRALGFEPVDRGDARRRVRLRGPADAARPFDLELWEPQLGLADARGGVHVDLGMRVPEPVETARRAFGDVDRARITETATGVVVRDPDDHRLELVAA